MNSLFPFLGNSRACLLFLVQERHGSEEKGPHAADFTLLLYKDFKVLVDNCDCEQDPGSRPNGTQEVSQDGEGPDAQPPKGSGSGNVPGEWEMRQQHATMQILPSWPAPDSGYDVEPNSFRDHDLL